MKQKLPVGLSSFERIRTENYLYVDKTEGIFRLIERGEVYFLSRPRRFGKSLLISTLMSLFKGEKALFKDLWIDKHGQWEWKEYPVVVLDFNSLPFSTPEKLNNSLLFAIENNAKKNGLTLESPYLETKFKELILKLKEKTNQNVVILVDEYDKPIINFIGGDKIKIGIENRNVLKSFYGVLKDAEVVSTLKFILMTGVSKFSKVSIFSELNNLYDLTMKTEVCDLLGYTHDELINCFATEINELANEHNLTESETIGKLKNWYNGYRFSKNEIKVYNPFSILQVFQSLQFDNYWFESGSPSFLVNLIKERNYPLPELENVLVEKDEFSTFDIEDLKLEALLFQTGYLTIKNIDDRLYSLTYPNIEVKNSLAKQLFISFSEIKNSSERSKFLLLADDLNEKKYEEFFLTVNSLYASIPYTLNSKRDEAYFHTIFYLMMTASGIDAKNEVLTSEGRIDMVIEFKSSIYIIEFKCNQSAQTGLKQIRDKKYSESYQSTGKEIYLVAINFSTKEKSVKEWDIEKSNTIFA